MALRVCGFCIRELLVVRNERLGGVRAGAARPTPAFVLLTTPPRLDLNVALDRDLVTGLLAVDGDARAPDPPRVRRAAAP